MEQTPKSPLMLSTLFGNERLLLIAFALTFYCLGTTFFEAFVNYRTWGLIGSREFAAYHRAVSPRVVCVMLLPIAAYLLCLLTLLWRRPPAVPAWFVALSLLLLSIAILSSIFVQVPIQRAFSQGEAVAPLLGRLIVSDLWLRKLPLALNAALWLGVFCWRPDVSSSHCSSPEQVVRRLIDEGFSRGRLEVCDELIADALVEHQDYGPHHAAGPAGVKAVISSLHGAFSDFTLRIEDLVTAGDTVWIRNVATGTNDGPYMGQPATKRPINVYVFDVLRVVDGRVVEHWGVPDRLGVRMQLSKTEANK